MYGPVEAQSSGSGGKESLACVSGFIFQALVPESRAAYVSLRM